MLLPAAWLRAYILPTFTLCILHGFGEAAMSWPENLLRKLEIPVTLIPRYILASLAGAGTFYIAIEHTQSRETRDVQVPCQAVRRASQLLRHSLIELGNREILAAVC
jgi:hypothetical protein